VLMLVCAFVIVGLCCVPLWLCVCVFVHKIVTECKIIFFEYFIEIISTFICVFVWRCVSSIVGLFFAF